MAKNKRAPKADSDQSKLVNVDTTESNSTPAPPAVQRRKPKRQPELEQPTTAIDEVIRELAHRKWEAAGCPAGDGFDFWLEAERELKAKQQT